MSVIFASILVQIALFYLAALVVKSKTYWILAHVSILNIFVYLIPDTSSWLIVACGAIDFITAYLIIEKGDIHKKYQISLLAIVQLVHWAGESSIFSDITPEWYTGSILIITLLQLMGAWYGYAVRNSEEIRPLSKHLGQYNMPYTGMAKKQEEEKMQELWIRA